MSPAPLKRLAIAVTVASTLSLGGCFDDNDNNYVAPPVVDPEPTLPESNPTGNNLRIYLNLLAEQKGIFESDYSGFTLHVWNNDTCGSYDGSDTDWNNGLPITNFDSNFGAYWDVPFKQSSTNCINFIPHRGDDKPMGGDARADLDKAQTYHNSVFTFRGDQNSYYTPMLMPPTDIIGASAIWSARNALLVPKGASKVELYSAALAGMAINGDTVSKFDQQIELTQTANNGAGFLAEWQIWALPDTLTDAQIKELAKGQLYVITRNEQDKIASATKVQTAGLLDDLYVKSGTANGSDMNYGAVISEQGTTFRLWAPSAKEVTLINYGSDKIKVAETPMTLDEASGSWTTTTSAMGHGDYYRYKVKVYHPTSDQVETYEVTDPYSLSLSMNSEYSQVVDLNHADLKPAGWDDLKQPHAQENPADIVIYETHIRDFSALNSTVTPRNRGKYNAFGEAESKPVLHLKSLSEHGVTHLHLLPTFDIATINEDPTKVANLSSKFNKLCNVNESVKNSDEYKGYCASTATVADILAQMKEGDSKDDAKVQRLNRLISATDSFNWGYDPFHYTVPEGSYSTNADGMTRIREFRDMVATVKQNIGMNVVMDVVYNHTNAAGPESKYSVLDKIVPGYYQRLNEVTGAVENSTCCANTAPENLMMGRLIKDSLVVWSRDYKIDAYRFDLMGHHPKTQIMEALEAVKKVDADTYFYGEGWDFGEVAGDRRFEQARQIHMGGTGVGTFSDRLRDAVRGGSPFDGGDDIRKTQGLGNGAFVDANEMNAVSKETALHYADLTRLGMAGNLKDYRMITKDGSVKRGDEIDYNGQPAGYAVDPSEIQNYVSKHDNQTLWDNNQYKIKSGVPVATRVRMQAVSLATAVLGQGVPFTHQGVELLRSKSMQRDSYDSGDWYNKVDYSLRDNNWNKGLPREDKDGSNWPLIEKIIADKESQPAPEHMQQMVEYYKELTNLRKNLPLLRLGKGDEVNKRVDFHNTGANQIPGLIVMSIDNGASTGTDIDPNNDAVVVAINATNDPVTVDLKVSGLEVSKKHTSDLTQNAAVDGTQLTIPAWSPVVFELPRVDNRGAGIPVVAK